jgi:hypothetical protein
MRCALAGLLAVQRIVYPGDQLVRHERFFYVMPTVVQKKHIPAWIAGHHHHAHFGPAFLQKLRADRTRHVRHHHVRKQKVDRFLGNALRLNSFRATGGAKHTEAAAPENLTNDLEHGVVILDNEDCFECIFLRLSHWFTSYASKAMFSDSEEHLPRRVRILSVEP